MQERKGSAYTVLLGGPFLCCVALAAVKSFQYVFFVDLRGTVLSLVWETQ